MTVIKQFDRLSTSYVNLAGLLRYLREQNFIGKVQVSVSGYEAEVELRGAEPPQVSEKDAGPGVIAGAMERLMVHSREPGGTITVFEAPPPTPGATEEPVVDSVDETNWDELLDIGSRVTAAIEHAVGTLGLDFQAALRAARIELGDDYSFLDPTSDTFHYKDKRINLNSSPPANVFVVGLSECLRRMVNGIAKAKDGDPFRETVAIELAVAARVRANGLGPFAAYLDRIAGTRVL